jgi:diguanylate cyclase (GGDEF)-like protein
VRIEPGKADNAERIDGFSSWSVDLATGVLRGSAELFAMHGASSEDGLTRPAAQPVFETWLELLPEPERRALESLRASVISTGRGGQIEYQVRDGHSVRWLSTVMTLGECDGSQAEYVCGYTFDVTARRRLEGQRRADSETLTEGRAVLDRIARGASIAETLEAGASWIEERIAGLGCAILLVDRQEGLMRQVAGPSLASGFAGLVDGLRVGEGFGPWGAAAARRRPVIVDDVRRAAVNGFTERLEQLDVRSLWVSPLYRTGGDEVIAVIAVYRSVPSAPSRRELELVATMGQLLALAIEHDRVADRVRKETNVDPLTGTLNRTRFMELINERAASSAVAVICVEIDRFKPLRLTLGQHAGDQLLAEVGRRLLRAAGSTGLVGHFSADEFGLTVDAQSQEAVRAVADEIVESFKAPFVPEDTEFFLSLSLGIAYSDGAAGAYELVRDAAAAMHAARAEGHGRQRVYDRQIATQLRDGLTREAELRRALAEHEFIMHYQPLLRLADRVWDRAETLVRWQHPTRGLIAPGEFIPLAEQAGLMVALGERVLELVIAQAKLWAQTLPCIQLSVNVSGIQLSRPSFGDRVLEMLDLAGLPPAALLFEVTESAILQDVGGARATISRLREMGIRTALDDFGTGYSSLARLGELPITGVKIDRAFVAGLGNDDKARAIFEAIAQIVRAHGLLIVAEGIEDERTLAEVSALGCDFVQGYHLCRPGPPELIAPVLGRPVPEHLVRALAG